jgi:hypothetical protein
MTHPLHGVHVAYTEQEIKSNEANGWKVHGPNPPVPCTMQEAPEGATMTITVAKKRGRPAKVK